MNFPRSVIIAELRWPEVTKTLRFVEEFLRFLDKMTPYGEIFKIMFRKFWSQHQSTLLCSNFVIFVRQKISEIVRYLVDKKKQNFACLSNCRYCVDRVQNLPGPAASNIPKVLQISSKSVRFSFGGVIAERVNTAQLLHRVNPIFGGSLASRRIINGTNWPVAVDAAELCWYLVDGCKYINSL